LLDSLLQEISITYLCVASPSQSAATLAQEIHENQLTKSDQYNLKKIHETQI